MILFRYIAFDILKTTTAVTLVLLLLVTSGRFAKYLSQASAGDLAPELLFSIMLYRIPEFLPLIVPLGLFVGIMLVFGRLYVDSEMIVINASGVSKRRILLLTLVPALALSVVVAALTLWGAPKGIERAQELVYQSKNTASPALFKEGSFLHNTKGDSVVQFESVDEEFNIGDGFVFNQRANGRIMVLKARDGKLGMSHSEAPKLSFYNGVVFDGMIGQSDFYVTRFAEYTHKLDEFHQQQAAPSRVDGLPTMDILHSDVREHQVALHWRFSLPTTVIVVCLLAIALSKTNHRTGRYAKMLPAILLYLLYILSLSGARHLINEQLLTIWLLWLTHFAYLAFAVVLLFREEIMNFR